MLSKLKWDVAGVTAHDFLPLLLARLPLPALVNTDMVQRHAQTFIALAARGKSPTIVTRRIQNLHDGENYAFADVPYIGSLVIFC